MNEPADMTAQAEHQHHRYVGHRIPWFVRLMWVGFWAFAIYYTVEYLFPALQTELLAPP